MREAVSVNFKALVDDAKSGKLQLPEFQRDWKWNRSQVLRLYDSIRKGYPISGFLTLDASDSIWLSPRLFEGIDIDPKPSVESYVLDGQQRITAGLILYYGLRGTGKSNYYLDLEALWKMAQAQDLDYDNKGDLEEFANNLDVEDNYIRARRVQDTDGLLDSHGLLWTPYLDDRNEFYRAETRYLEKYPDRVEFMRLLVEPYFQLGSGPLVPVTVLDSEMSVEVITRVFETTNTSGQRLTPVEIVTATLFSDGIHLRQEIEDFRTAKEYYSNIESTGELFLQAIALMSGKNPKKTTLPKTIDQNNYSSLKDSAASNLDRAGKFLSDRLGVGLHVNNALISYPAILPPLGIGISEIEKKYPGPGPDRTEWYEKMDRWYVGSVLTQRYTESQPATQMRDNRELQKWIREGDESIPEWLNNVRVGSLDTMSPNSAIGKLVASLISRQRPKDPLNKEDVGRKDADVTSLQSHHVFPKAFCEQHIPEWPENSKEHDLALNVMPLTRETNNRWDKMNPSEQIADVRNKGHVSEKELIERYSPFFIDAECLEIMKDPDKTIEKYRKFIKTRGKVVQEYIAQTWNFPLEPSEEPMEDAEDA